MNFMKWFVGVSSAITIAVGGWAWSFILMGYQVKADMNDMKVLTYQMGKENANVKAELMTVKEITMRTENNTEKIRDVLLKRALPMTGNNN